MNTDIRYIFLDLGGTFRVIREDRDYIAAAKGKIAELCGVTDRDPTEFFDTVIDPRYDLYRDWALNYMEKIRQGAIGTPYLVKATSIDPDAQAEQFIRYTAHSAGIFLDLGIHDIDLMRWFLGSEVAEIFALGGTFKHPEFRDAGDEETAVAALRFQNGAMVRASTWSWVT